MLLHITRKKERKKERKPSITRLTPQSFSLTTLFSISLQFTVGKIICQNKIWVSMTQLFSHKVSQLHTKNFFTWADYWMCFNMIILLQNQKHKTNLASSNSHTLKHQLHWISNFFPFLILDDRTNTELVQKPFSCIDQ